MRDPGRIIILGAGPCGLGAAYRLIEIGHGDFAVYEGAAAAGGLASSITDERRFVWDYGCHVLYSHYKYFNDLLDKILPGALIEQPREAHVWIDGRFVPYPFQYNLHRLSNDVRRECVLGLAAAATRPTPTPEANFKEWIVNTFGHGIAKHFMLPYNAKVWAYPPEQMDVDWIAERVPRPDLQRVLANLLDGKDDGSWGPNARFHYPAMGGTGTIWRRFAEIIGRDHVTFERMATGIDPARRRVTFADGSDERYDTLISTIPIDRLVDLAGLGELQPAARQLSSSDVHVVGIGMEGPLPAELDNKKWIYFPDLGLPFYRATILSNFAPSNAPAGCWSLLAETAHSPYRPVVGERIVDDTIAGFRREGIIPRGARIVSRFHHVAAPGYPTPTLVRNRALETLIPALERFAIYSRGRFGAWRYEIANQDHAFMQGAELAARLLLGEAEPTISS